MTIRVLLGSLALVFTMGACTGQQTAPDKVEMTGTVTSTLPDGGEGITLEPVPESPFYDENGLPLPVMKWYTLDGETFAPYFASDPDDATAADIERVARTLCHNLSDDTEVNTECDTVHYVDLEGRLPVLAYAVLERPADPKRCAALSNAIASFRSSEYHIPPLNDFVMARDHACGCRPFFERCMQLSPFARNEHGPPDW